MKKKAAAERDDRSLKTFFMYSSIVLVLILTSLVVKAFIIAGQSKYDGKYFTLGIASSGIIVKVAGFDAENNSISQLDIKKGNLTKETIRKDMGVAPDGIIDIKSDSASGIDTHEVLENAFWKRDGTTTDLTFFDLTRLIYFVKNAKIKSDNEKYITYPISNSEVNRIILSQFTDDRITAENVSIEIINATDVAGLGQRIDRILSNIGANVISVSTARNTSHNSKIKYFGSETYTLSKIEKLFNFPAEAMKEKSIGDIVIIIGDDQKGSYSF